MDGIIVIDKPLGCTSHDIVRRVKKVLNEKVGHTGTLDPMATGVLPLLIGKGTLCSKYLINHDKVYQVTLQLGKRTDTADSEGNVIEEKEVKKEFLNKSKIEKVLNSFLGEQKQTPPIYSAIKVNGKKLYEYARKGEKVEIPSRIINIYSIKCIKIDVKQNQINFEVSCSKGTYIRSLCEDIAKKMETVGYMKALRRLKVGDFDIKNALSSKNLEDSLNNKEVFYKYFISVEELFRESDSIVLSDRLLNLFLNGVMLDQNCKDGIYKIYCKEQFVGIGVVNRGLLKRDIVVV